MIPFMRVIKRLML